MRRCVWIVSLTLLAACSLGGAVVAAEENGDQGGLVIVEEVTISPSGMEAYETASKKLLPILAEHDFPYAFDAYTTDDFRYLFVYPIKDFADIDSLYASWTAFVQSWGMDKWEAMQREIAGAVESTTMSVFRFRAGLSYLPDGDAHDPSKSSYMYWGTCRVRPGMENALEKSFRDFAKLFAAKEMPSGWATYQAYFGTQMPMYVYAEWGDSPAAFWTRAERTQEKAGEAAAELWRQTMSTLRGYEYMTGRSRPDLSYRPAPEEAAEE